MFAFSVPVNLWMICCSQHWAVYFCLTLLTLRAPECPSPFPCLSLLLNVLHLFRASLLAPECPPPFPCFSPCRFTLSINPFTTFQSSVDYTVHTFGSIEKSIVKVILYVYCIVTVIHSLVHRTTRQVLSLSNSVVEHLTMKSSQCTLIIPHRAIQLTTKSH